MNALAKARSWIEEQVSQIRLKAPATVHLDELLGLPPTDLCTAEELELALEAFRGVLNAPSINLDTMLPLLVIPLEHADELRVTPVQWSQLPGLKMDAPPTIYVLDRRAMQLANDAEEYRCPIEVPFAFDGDMRIHSYYRCFRDARAIQQGWEFASCLYLEAVWSPA